MSETMPSQPLPRIQSNQPMPEMVSDQTISETTPSQANASRIVRMVVGIIAIAAMVFCGVQLVSAFTHSNITMSSKSGDIDVKGNKFNGLIVTPSLVFNEIGDSITYQVPLSAKDGSKFQIKKVSDDNTNPYITTSYTYDEDMDANNKAINITLTYAKSVPFGEEVGLKDIHIKATIEEKSPSAPNTGANATKYLNDLQNGSDQADVVMIYSIICAVALVVVIIAIVPKKHHVKFGAIILVILSPALLAINQAHAESSDLEITIISSNISATPIVDSPEDVVTFVFPNIYNNKVQDRTSGMAPGDAIIMKTLDDKYVLLDTGPKTADIRGVIYDKLKELQESDDVVIDYLIISHLDGDHYGNAVTLINDERYTFKNIIVKHEQYSEGFTKETAFTNITEAAHNHNINIITNGDEATTEYMNTLIGSTNYDKLIEGMVVQVGKYLKLDLFNVDSVYNGKICKEGYSLAWTAKATSTDLLKTADNKYIYFDGSEYPDITFRTTDTPVTKENESGISRYFYAAYGNSGESHNICRSNPNAFGILAEVTTTGLSKYAYFANDIENAGYSRLASGANSSQLFENLSFVDGEFVTDVTPYTIPSEINAANSIYDKLSADATAQDVTVDDLLDNIVIYQQSHHGINNNEEALWKLNLNRTEGIYSILENSTNQATNTAWGYAKTYWYTLGNIPAENKLRVGDSTKDGINCRVDMLGDTACVYYQYE